MDSLSTLLVLATFALPFVPAEGESWPWWFVLYAVAFLAHWSVLLTIVAARLWLAGRSEATVARRRMRLLAVASIAITLALLLAVGFGGDRSTGELVVGLIVTLSAIAFLLGLSPPATLRMLWRRPEQARVQSAVGELMTATSEEDVAARVLEPMALIVGARGIALEDADGRRIGTHGTVDGDSVTTWAFPFGRLVVHTSTFAPYFGDEERKLLQTLGSLTGLALDRARLFAQERESRVALERADELKSEFVALAAHELRSPVGAIYGISETLAERGPQLSAEQTDELQGALTQQIRRLRELVEQLLDLSRLDAEAVVIRPQRVGPRAARADRRLSRAALGRADRDRGRPRARRRGGRRRPRPHRHEPRQQRVPVRRAADRRQCRGGVRRPPRDRLRQRPGRAGGVRAAALRPLRTQLDECGGGERDGPRTGDRASYARAHQGEVLYRRRRRAAPLSS